MAIQEAKQQHPDMLVTKAVVIRETESPTDELHQKAEVKVYYTVACSANSNQVTKTYAFSPWIAKFSQGHIVSV